MHQRQDKLWEQRVLLSRLSRLSELERNAVAKWREKQNGSSRAASWWSFNGADDGTRQNITYWNTSSGQLEEQVRSETRMPDHDDWSQLPSTRHYSSPTGSWKILGLGKSCNGPESPEHNSRIGGRVIPGSCGSGESMSDFGVDRKRGMDRADEIFADGSSGQVPSLNYNYWKTSKIPRRDPGEIGRMPLDLTCSLNRY
jgi:hypothetical protein